MIDIDKLSAEFKESSERLISKLEAVPEDVFFNRPEENKWSVGEIAEHLYKVERPVISFLKGKKSEEPSPKPERKKAIIERAFSDTSKKFTAHGTIVPQKDFTAKDEVINTIKETRDNIAFLITSVDLNYVCLDFPHPLLGEMTGVEWIHFIMLHSDRHINQFRY